MEVAFVTETSMSPQSIRSHSCEEDIVSLCPHLVAEFCIQYVFSFVCLQPFTGMSVHIVSPL